jgi:hypothetical protein
MIGNITPPPNPIKKVLMTTVPTTMVLSPKPRDRGFSTVSFIEALRHRFQQIVYIPSIGIYSLKSAKIVVEPRVATLTTQKETILSDTRLFRKPTAITDCSLIPWIL